MLSKRLLKIAEFIKNDKVVLDVGCDHGLLPCFLVKQGICSKVYASDNKPGPLARAKENINKLKLNDNIIPVLADGLEKMEIDVEVVVIAGMGYYTIESILDKADLSRLSYLVVQVNKHPSLLREYISIHNWTILDEAIVKDDFYYEIIVFNTEKHSKYDQLEIDYGPCLLKKQEPIFKEYLLFKKAKYQEIITNSNNQLFIDKITEIDKILKEGTWKHH